MKYIKTDTAGLERTMKEYVKFCYGIKQRNADKHKGFGVRRDDFVKSQFCLFNLGLMVIRAVSLFNLNLHISFISRSWIAGESPL
jgi:hypothetical protein